MTPAQAASPASVTASSPHSPEPSVEATHLRRLVEKQPACLMRVAEDGTILAANDAALGLLGAKTPADVLGHPLHGWIVPAHLQIWKDFVSTVASGTSVSVECDVKDLQAVERSVVFHGVPLIDHVDGIPSVILGARDSSGVRRLEAALQESESARQKLAATQSIGPAAAEELRELQARLDEASSARARLEQSVSKMPQLEQLLKQGKTHLQELRTRLESATAERDRIAAQLHERENANEQLWSDQVQLQHSLAEQHDRDVVQLRSDLEQAQGERGELRNEVHALRAQLEEGHTELGALRTAVAQLNEDRERVIQELRDAGGRQRESDKALADQRVELQSLDMSLRKIEPLAAAGRAAFDIANELAALTGDIDARAACLIAESPHDAPGREQIEQLRADAVRAGSLARQILQTRQIGPAEEGI